MADENVDPRGDFELPLQYFAADGARINVLESIATPIRSIVAVNGGWLLSARHIHHKTDLISARQVKFYQGTYYYLYDYERTEYGTGQGEIYKYVSQTDVTRLTDDDSNGMTGTNTRLRKMTAISSLLEEE